MLRVPWVMHDITNALSPSPPAGLKPFKKKNEEDLSFFTSVQAKGAKGKGAKAAAERAAPASATSAADSKRRLNHSLEILKTFMSLGVDVPQSVSEMAVAIEKVGEGGQEGGEGEGWSGEPEERTCSLPIEEWRAGERGKRKALACGRATWQVTSSCPTYPHFISHPSHRWRRRGWISWRSASGPRRRPRPPLRQRQPAPPRR